MNILIWSSQYCDMWIMLYYYGWRPPLHVPADFIKEVKGDPKKIVDFLMETYINEPLASYLKKIRTELELAIQKLPFFRPCIQGKFEGAESKRASSPTNNKNPRSFKEIYKNLPEKEWDEIKTTIKENIPKGKNRDRSIAIAWLLAKTKICTPDYIKQYFAKEKLFLSEKNISEKRKEDWLALFDVAASSINQTIHRPLNALQRLGLIKKKGSNNYHFAYRVKSFPRHGNQSSSDLLEKMQEDLHVLKQNQKDILFLLKKLFEK